METSPIRISEADKAQIRKLAQDLSLARGRQVSQQETMSRAVVFAMEHRDDFLRQASWAPLTPAQVQAWHDAISKIAGWDPVPVDAIDDVVYGG